jgi:hypothetical protein
MAKDILRNVRIFMGGCDLTAQSNKIDLGGEFEEKDATVFTPNTSGPTPKEVLIGLFGGKVAASGLWDAGDPSLVDDAMWAARGGHRVWTVGPGAAEGGLAYLQYAANSSYQLGGQVGDIAPWQASATGSGAQARGKWLSAPGTARATVGTSTTGIVDLGAPVPAGKRLHASLHVLSVAGTGTPTVTATVQSAAAIGFAGPTARLVFPAVTTVTGHYLSLDGPITDQFYRLSFSISGTSPSFLIAAAVGID